MRQLTTAEVHAQKVAELGLDPTRFDLTSVGAIACAIRRAASFLCPCTPSTLIRAVVRPLRGLIDDHETVRGAVEDVLEALVAHGDILEQSDIDADSSEDSPALLYTAPPTFVARESGQVLLLGVAPDQVSVVPDDLEARIEHVGHVRRIHPVAGEDLRGSLLDLGLNEIPATKWLRLPQPEAADELVERFDRLLDAVHPSREVPGLVLLESARPVRFYRGRWAEPRSQDGRFVARRKQAYGADLWCYVELRTGTPERLVDLPLKGSRWRGCDEAWHLQMAIDAQRGEPQRLRIRPGPESTHVLELFSPVPMWARRRWDAVGEPVSVSGCLFAYRLADTELAEELRFARETMWLCDWQDAK